MYPLHMKSAAGGFALANDEAEHRALTGHDYEPALVSRPMPPEAIWSAQFNTLDNADPAPDELATLRAEAKAAGVKRAHLMGRDKLLAALGR